MARLRRVPDRSDQDAVPAPDLRERLRAAAPAGILTSADEEQTVDGEVTPRDEGMQELLLREYGDAPFTMTPQGFVDRYRHTFVLGGIFTANHPDLTVRRWAHEVARILTADNPPAGDGQPMFEGTNEELFAKLQEVDDLDAWLDSLPRRWADDG